MKKLLSILLALCMMLTVVPMAAFAEEENLPEETVVTVTDTPDEALPPEEEADDAGQTDENSAPDQSEELPVSDQEEETPAPDQEEETPAPDQEEEIPAPVENKETVSSERNSESTGNVQTEEETDPLGGLVDLPKITGVSAYSFSETKIAVSWNKADFSKVQDPNHAGYEVRWSTSSDMSGASYHQIADTTATEYTITGLTVGNRYYISVLAYYADGTTSYGLAGTTNCYAAPSAPTYLDCTYLAPYAVTLSWDKVTSADGYIIRRSEDGVNFSEIATIYSYKTVSYKDYTLTAGINYTYRIYSYRDEVESTDYADAEWNCKPDTPQNVKAVSAGPTAITLSWDQVAGVDGYFVYRSNDNGSSYTNIGSTGSYTETSYTDSYSIVIGREYLYYVVSYYGTAESDPSSVVSGIASISAPTGLAITPVSTTSMTVSWDPDSYATGYILEASSNNSTWSEVYRGSNSSYTETGLSVGQLRFYRVYSYVVIGSETITSQTSSATAWDAPRPAAPEKLKLTNYSYNQIYVTWNEADSASGYQLERSTNEATWTIVKRLSGSSSLSYTDTVPDEGVTYYYRVAAYVDVTVNSTTSHLCGPYSAESTITAKLPAPSLLYVEDTTRKSSGNSVTLAWTEVEDADGYKVYYRKTGDADWILSATTNSATLTSTVTGIELQTEYDFRVCGYHISSSSTKVNGVSAYVKDYVLDLVRPASLTKTNVNTTTMVISWTDQPSVDGYTVVLSSPDDPTCAETIDTESNCVTLTELTCGYRYVVQVSSYCIRDGVVVHGPYTTNDSSDPNYDPTRLVTFGYYYTTPEKVTGLTVVSASSPYAISLSWDVVDDAEGYIVLRSDTLDGTYEEVYQTGSATETRYNDIFTVGDVGTAYYYRVRSYVIGPNSTVKGSASSKVMGIVAPGKAGSVKLTTVNKTSIKITWDSIPAVSGYEILRSTSKNGTYTAIKTINDPSTLTYTDTGLTTGKTYYYVIRGFVKYGTTYCYGVTSDKVSRRAVAAAPKNVQVTLKSSTQVLLTWSRVSQASSYAVYISTSVDGSYTRRVIVSGTTASKQYATIGELTPGKIYYFRVRSLTSDSVESYPSSIVSCEMTVPQVEDLEATVVSTTSLKLTWTTISGVYAYEVEYSSDGGETWSSLTKGATSNSYTATGLVLGRVYEFRVRAYNMVDGSKLYGDYSEVLEAGTKSMAPTSLKVTSYGTNRVTLSWKQGTGSVGYLLRYRMKNSNGSYGAWITVKTVTTADTSITQTVTGLKSGKTYQFQVLSRYVNESGVTVNGLGSKVTCSTNK